METKTITVVIAGLAILALLFAIVISYSYSQGIPVFQIILERLSKVASLIPFVTGNMTDWPEWAK
jgi:hypothetical protein